MILPYGNDLGRKRSRGNIWSVRGAKGGIALTPVLCHHYSYFFQFIKSDFGSLNLFEVWRARCCRRARRRKAVKSPFDYF